MHKTILLAMVVLATVAPSALASDDPRVDKEIKWIERTEKDAYDYCKRSSLPEAQKVRGLCDEFNICSDLPACTTVVHRWRIKEIERLKKNPDQYFYEVERRKDRAGSR